MHESTTKLRTELLRAFEAQPVEKMPRKEIEVKSVLQDCPGGFMGLGPRKEHVWSIPNRITGMRECLLCCKRVYPVTVDAEAAEYEPPGRT